MSSHLWEISMCRLAGVCVVLSLMRMLGVICVTYLCCWEDKLLLLCFCCLVMQRMHPSPTRLWVFVTLSKMTETLSKDKRTLLSTFGIHLGKEKRYIDECQGNEEGDSMCTTECCCFNCSFIGSITFLRHGSLAKYIKRHALIGRHRLYFWIIIQHECGG